MELAVKSGFDAIDFDLELYGGGSDPIYKSFDAIEEHFSKIKERADELGLIISQTHGRCRTNTPQPEHCEYAKWVSERDLYATSLLGAPACVIHNITTGRWGLRSADFMHAKNAEFIADIAPFAEKYGVAIGFETFGDSHVDGKRYIDFFGDSNELIKQYNMTKTKNKVICLDTGHTNKAQCVAREHGFEVPGVAESVRIFGKELKLLHLHDNNSYSDQHLPPRWAGSDGAINWDEVMAALDEVGYSGVYNFELNLSYFGQQLGEMIPLLGKYLRAFVDKYE
jgi:sugar phosphate isomerase/epimerase